MTMKLYSEESIQAIADAIRNKNGESTLYKVGEMAQAILNIPSGGGITADDIAGGLVGVGALSMNGTVIKEYSFYRCTGITSFVAPNVTTLGGYAFTGCTGLTSIYFPNLTTFGNSKQGFQGCTSLTKIHMPKIGNCGDSLFKGCTSLVNVVFSQENTAYGSTYQCFYGCTNLEKIDIGYNTLSTQTFYNCSKLDVIILRSDNAICPMSNANTFQNTPFASGHTGGTIYIPEAMYNHLGDGSSLDYKSASLWSTVDGYGTITWAKIEGSIYETQYADGTPIE